MAGFRFDQAQPSNTPSSGSGGQFRFDQIGPAPTARPDGSFRFDRVQTGQNLQGTQSGWDTDFQREFQSGWQRATEEGRADRYFLDKNTGVAAYDHVDPNDPNNVVRSGDVFYQGKKVGNLRDKFGDKDAELYMMANTMKAGEQVRGESFQAVRERGEAQIQDSLGRKKYEADVKAEEQKIDSDWDFWAPAAGAAGGALTGATMGVALGPLGAVAGALIGGALGGFGGWANQDQITEQMARMNVQQRYLEEKGRKPASMIQEFQRYGSIASMFTGQTLQNVVQGATDLSLGKVDDGDSAYYNRDKSDLGQNILLGGLNAVAGFGDSLAQFASPVGRAIYAGTMSTQIGTQVAGLVANSGETFDEMSGSYDNIFLDREGNFDPLSAAAGLGSIGIDVAQLGLGRGIGKSVSNGVKKEVGDGLKRFTESGWTFVRNEKTGDIVKARLSWQTMAPSEMVQALATRSRAQVGNVTPKPSAQQIYDAAMFNAAGKNSLRGAALVNGFGEATEEGVQAVFESASHGRMASFDDVSASYLAGFVSGAGMTVGARAGVAMAARERTKARSEWERRLGGQQPVQLPPDKQFDRYTSLMETRGAPGEGGVLTKQEFLKLPEAERVALATASPAENEALSRAANDFVEGAKQTLTAGEPAMTYIAGQRQDLRAKEQADVNAMLEGSFQISQAAYGVKNTQVLGSLNTIFEALKRRDQALTEIVNMPDITPEAKAFNEAAQTALQEKVLPEVAAVVRLFNDPKSSEKTRQRAVAGLNRYFDDMESVNPADAERVAEVAGASMVFLRNPTDNPGSFPLLLPKISYVYSMEKSDGFLQVPVGVLKGMGADFDGDKMMSALRIALTPESFRNLRSGRSQQGSTSEGWSTITSSDFEQNVIRVAGDALRSHKDARKEAAKQLIHQLRLKLRDQLKHVNGGYIGLNALETFLQDVQAGSPSAKQDYLNKLATTHVQEVLDLADSELRNVISGIDSVIQNELIQFQRAHAATMEAKFNNRLAHPAPKGSRAGAIAHTRAVNFTAKLSWSSAGFDIFRKWQGLHYSSYNSPELIAAVDDPTTLQEMTAFLEALSAGKTRSDLAELFGKDAISQKVLVQLEKMASRLSQGQGSPMAMVQIANMVVPDLRDGRFHGKTTLVKFLVNQQVEKEYRRAQSLGVVPDTMKSRHAALRAMNHGEMFVEVFGGMNLATLLGQDATHLGHMTVGEWVLDFSNQSQTLRSETTRLVKQHASYHKLNREQGKHNLPYYMNDFEGTNPVSPYQSVVDSMLQAGNNVITWSKETGKVGGRQGDKSNQVGESFRDSVRALQKLALTLKKVDKLTAAQWQELIDARPELASAFYSLLKDKMLDGAIYENPTTHEVRIAPWIFDMLSMRPEQAEMEYLRRSLMAGREFVSSDGTNGLGYYGLQDRLLRLEYGLSKSDPRMHAVYQEKLLTAKSTDEFIAFVNNYIRNNEAPYTAWARDVAVFDPSVTQGGWSRQLPSTELTETLTKLKSTILQQDAEVIREIAENDQDAALLAQMREVMKDPDYKNSGLYQGLKKTLDFAAKYPTAVGPSVRLRALATLTLGLFGHPSDKGVAATGTVALGTTMTKGASFLFGTSEEQFIGEMTAFSTRDVAQEPALLAKGDRVFLDPQGNVVEWKVPSPEEFLALWENPENRPRLREIFFPTVLSHTLNDQVELQLQESGSLAHFVEGDKLNQMYFGHSNKSKRLYLSMLDSKTNGEVTRYLMKLVGARLGQRQRQLRSIEDAAELVLQAELELADALRAVGDLGEHGGIQFDVMYDVWKQELAADLAQRRTLGSSTRAHLMSSVGPQDVGADDKSILYRILNSMNAQRVNDVPLAEYEAMSDSIEEFVYGKKSNVLAQLKGQWGMPTKNSDESAKDFADRTLAARQRLLTYVLSDRGIENRARWSDAIRRLRNWRLEDLRGEAGELMLTDKEWKEISDVVIANEIQLSVSTTLGSHDNMKLDKLSDPDMEFLVEPFSPDSPILRAAIALQAELGMPREDDMTQRDVLRKVQNTVLNPKRLGIWDDRTAEIITQGLDRINSSPAGLGIAQGGNAPSGETTVGIAQTRTEKMPEASAFTQIRLSAKQVLNEHRWVFVQMTTPPPKVLHVSSLNGRAARSVIMTLPDGTQVDLLQEKDAPAGLTRGADRSLRFITTNRIRRSMEEYLIRNGLPAETAQGVVFDIDYVDPEKQPAGREWANNVWFEGTVMESGGDNFTSLESAWFLGFGGIDGSASARALSSAKKKAAAILRHVMHPSKEIDSLLETRRMKDGTVLRDGWDTNLHVTLMRLTNVMMGWDMGDGSRPNPEFWNAAYKMLKSRHAVRGLDADGNVQVLSAEQVIALQAAGDPIPLQNPEPYRFSEKAIRTMMGESGDRGEARVNDDVLRVDQTTIARWEGEYTQEHFDRLPGMKNLERLSLWDTHFRSARSAKRMIAVDELDQKTREQDEKIAQSKFARMQSVFEARLQMNSPDMIRNSMNNALSVIGSYIDSPEGKALMRAGLAFNSPKQVGMLRDLVNQAALTGVQKILESKQLSAGFVFSFGAPPTSAQGKFGEVYGLDGLLRNQSGPTQMAKNDLVVMSLDDNDVRDDTEISRVVDLLTDTNVTVALAASPSGIMYSKVSRELRRRGYQRAMGSPLVFEPEPMDAQTLTIESRYDRMIEVKEYEVGKLMLNLISDELAVVENTAVLFPEYKDTMSVVTHDLVPTNTWPNYSLPVGQVAVERVKHLLAQEEWPAIISQAELAQGRPLTGAELNDLKRALAKVKDIDETGFYRPDVILEVGDIIPLWNPNGNGGRGSLILTRNGHKAQEEAGRIEAQFAHPEFGKVAVYSASLEQAATTHTGKILRVLRTRANGIQVQLLVKLGKYVEKMVVEGTGFKVTTISPNDPDSPFQGLKFPKGLPGWAPSQGYSLADTKSKGNWLGVVDNLQQAATFLGIDFREMYAEALGLDPADEKMLSQVTRMLATLKRHLPKMTKDQVTHMLDSDSMGPEINSLLSQHLPTVMSTLEGLPADFDVARFITSLDGAMTPAQRTLRAAIMYLSYEDADLNLITSVPGVAGENSRLSGTKTFSPPLLFLQTLMDQPVGSETRQYFVEKFQRRFASEQGTAGWVMNQDFSVTIYNENAKHTFTAFMQFPEMHSSGDSPRLQLMADARKSSQTSSPANTANVNMMFGSQVALSKQPKKLRQSVERQQEEMTLTGVELLRKLNNFPDTPNLNIPRPWSYSEREYRKNAANMQRLLRQPIDVSNWTEDERAEFNTRRRELSNIYGVNDVVVDYWIRYHTFQTIDENATPGDEKGLVSSAHATDAISHMLGLARKGMFPLQGATVRMMHPIDLKQMFDSYQRGDSSFQLTNMGDALTSLEDWIKVAVGMTEHLEDKPKIEGRLADDGAFHLYQDLGLAFVELGSSIDTDVAVALVSDEMKAAVISISPAVRDRLAAQDLDTISTELSDIYFGKLHGLRNFNDKDLKGSAHRAADARITGWHQNKKIPTDSNLTLRDNLTYGDRLVREGTTMASWLRGLENIRVGNSLSNVMLFISAPVEQFQMATIDNLSSMLIGDSTFARTPGASGVSQQEITTRRMKLSTLGKNKDLVSLLNGEFSMDEPPVNANRFEYFTHKYAKWSSMLQDPYYRMRPTAMVRSYVEAAVHSFDAYGVYMDPNDLMDQLMVNPSYLRDVHPKVHMEASGVLRNRKNTRDTVLSKFVAGTINPMANSSYLAVSIPSVLFARLPYKFFGYASNKAIQLTGMQGLNAFAALWLHGRKKPALFTAFQNAVQGTTNDPVSDTFDMQTVIEAADLTREIVKSGITHSMLMAGGLLAGSLGLSGEDDEDRRRRRLEEAQGVPHLYDPRDMVNDFRNADAIYLDWLPPFMSEMFRTPGHEDTGGDRRMAHMNWILRSVLSPIIGMERYFNTGDMREIWWGYEDAFYSFPLVNTMFSREAATVFNELQASAEEIEGIGSPEALPEFFGAMVKGVADLERMLLEHSFINMIYIASDPFDRDAYVKVNRDAAGNITRDELGLPERSTAMRDYIDPKTGQVAQGYLPRDWQDSRLAGFAENRATLALLSTMISKIGGGDSYMRGDMAVKHRSVDKPELTIESSKAIIRSMFDGVLKPDDPVMQGVYIPMEHRRVIEKELKEELTQYFTQLLGTEKKGVAAMWNVWKGDPTNPTVPALKDVVYSSYKFDKAISYTPTQKYLQLNTTYVKGPGGGMWATGIDRHSLFNLAGIAPLQRSFAPSNQTEGTDIRGNYVDKVLGINTGMRGLMRVDETFKQADKESDAEKAAAASLSSAPASNGWVDYENSGRSGWRNFGKSGWRNFGRRGGGGGRGGGGSFTRINAPERQSVPYANDVQNINTNNPLIRRAQIRRERIDSEKGRLNQWQ